MQCELAATTRAELKLTNEQLRLNNEHLTELVGFEAAAADKSATRAADLTRNLAHLAGCVTNVGVEVAACRTLGGSAGKGTSAAWPSWQEVQAQQAAAAAANAASSGDGWQTAQQVAGKATSKVPGWLGVKYADEEGGACLGCQGSGGCHWP